MERKVSRLRARPTEYWDTGPRSDSRVVRNPTARRTSHTFASPRSSMSTSPHPSDSSYSTRWPERVASPGGEKFGNYYRANLARLRQLELQYGRSERLTGPRRSLKRILRAMGNENSLTPKIEDDGEGGVFATWLVTGHKLEVGVESSGDGYALAINRDGKTLLNEDFAVDDELPLSVMKSSVSLLRALTIIVLDEGAAVAVDAGQ